MSVARVLPAPVERLSARIVVEHPQACALMANSRSPFPKLLTLEDRWLELGELLG
ncbi:MAG: hypothetical protein JST33_13185 [Actinobacteria bacterium]|nr:hypothetical protein [Actinomycetota bacterium]